MAACSGCGATVFWRANASTGKQAPVDARPDPKGNVVIDSGAYKVLTKAEMSALDIIAQDKNQRQTVRYNLHFATCPKAGTFRRCSKCHKTPCSCPKETG